MRLLVSSYSIPAIQEKQHLYTTQGFHQHLVRKKNYTGSEDQLRRVISKLKKQKGAAVHMADTPVTMGINLPFNNAVFQQQKERTDVQSRNL